MVEIAECGGGEVEGVVRSLVQPPSMLTHVASMLTQVANRYNIPALFIHPFLAFLTQRRP